MKNIFLAALLCAASLMANSQPYKDAGLPVEKRVQDLLARMTPEEKFWQLFMIPGDLGKDSAKFKTGIFGLQINTEGRNTDATQQTLDDKHSSSAYAEAARINSIQRFFVDESRLGIPVIPFDEALHGLVREGATSFPQSIGLAATWNTDLMHEVATAIAKECRSRGIRQVLSPVVNIASDVRWGRTEETYGEDPFLTSAMGVAFVSAFEKNGVITTPKHFVSNVGDGGRDSYPIQWSERLMREVYLPPFEACISLGGSRSVMTAYNSYDGKPCTANDFLLNRLLKKEWNFKGFVISDAGATGGANVLHMTAKDYPDATTKSMNAGLDVILQTNYDHYKLFSPPFLDGSIDQRVIDEAVARVLRAKFELGLFEKPYADPDSAKYWNGDPDHRKLAKEAALQSIVLLKNERNVLPLSKSLRTIAVIGPDAAEARLGGYSGPGIQKISILEGIKNKVDGKAEIKYTLGCDRKDLTYVIVPADALSSVMNGKEQQGLTGTYYNNVSFSGEPVFTRSDPQVNFQWTLYSPDPQKLSYDFYAVNWQGKIKAPESGDFMIGIDGNDGYRLYLDGKLIIDNWIKRGRETRLATFHFEKGREYDILIEYYEPLGNAWFKLVWNIGVDDRQNEKIEKAVQLTAGSDVAVIVAGIEEGEFQDRALLGLPGRQEELIKKVAATRTPVVVVLVAGSAVTMSSWINDVPGILAVWYPGEEGGDAVADVLFGDYNPAGRLPITFPVLEGQLPLVYNHKPTGRGDDYINLTGQPLFPFGYGLSYTSFEYTNIRLGSASIGPSDSTWVSVDVKNIGKIAGDEVVQMYIRDELSSYARPVMELKGFNRIRLEPGETREVRFVIRPELLAMLDANYKWYVEPGDFRIMIGASSKDIRQRIILKVND